MNTILMVPYRRLVLDHPGSITSNHTARLNTTHQQRTTTRSVTIDRPERLFEVLSWPPLKAGPSNRTGKIAPKTIVTALNPHKAGQRHS
jgi:hypothetical protein